MLKLLKQENSFSMFLFEYRLFRGKGSEVQSGKVLKLATSTRSRSNHLKNLFVVQN